jgi:beta-phosphoglucomutase-like phosphatase (HAD superfamily)
VIFDLDALADLECDGHRVVFNAAFAAHGLPIGWTVPRYRQLLALRDERQRVTAELRKRCVCTECDVLTELLADEISATKAMMFEEMILDVGLTPRPGLVDLVMDAFGAGIPVSVVTRGRRSWAEPLVRQLVGEGLVETIVTGDDVMSPAPAEVYHHALGELGITHHDAVAVTGSVAGLSAAGSAGMATILIDADARDLPAAVAVRADYGGVEPLDLATCERLHARWWTAHTPSVA